MNQSTQSKVDCGSVCYIIVVEFDMAISVPTALQPIVITRNRISTVDYHAVSNGIVSDLYIRIGLKYSSQPGKMLNMNQEESAVRPVNVGS